MAIMKKRSWMNLGRRKSTAELVITVQHKIPETTGLPEHLTLPVLPTFASFDSSFPFLAETTEPEEDQRKQPYYYSPPHRPSLGGSTSSSSTTISRSSVRTETDLEKSHKIRRKPVPQLLKIDVMEKASNGDPSQEVLSDRNGKWLGMDDTTSTAGRKRTPSTTSSSSSYYSAPLLVEFQKSAYSIGSPTSFSNDYSSSKMSTTPSSPATSIPTPSSPASSSSPSPQRTSFEVPQIQIDAPQRRSALLEHTKIALLPAPSEPPSIPLPLPPASPPARPLSSGSFTNIQKARVVKKHVSCVALMENSEQNDSPPLASPILGNSTNYGDSFRLVKRTTSFSATSSYSEKSNSSSTCASPTRVQRGDKTIFIIPRLSEDLDVLGESPSKRKTSKLMVGETKEEMEGEENYEGEVLEIRLS